MAKPLGLGIFSWLYLICFKVFPNAICICALTISKPRMLSVTVCSTCNLALPSIKQNLLDLLSNKNSTVHKPLYLIALVILKAASISSNLTSLVKVGLGATSIIF